MLPILSLIAILAVSLAAVPMRLTAALNADRGGASLCIGFGLLYGLVPLRLYYRVGTNDEGRLTLFIGKYGKKSRPLFKKRRKKRKRKRSQIAFIRIASGCVTPKLLGFSGVIGSASAAERAVIASGSLRAFATTLFALAPQAERGYFIRTDMTKSAFELKALCIARLDAGKLIIKTLDAKRRKLI